ncbi:MAG: ABC transporter substrate-binding protein [Chloroflexi bacterium]|nr:ABC transporter substrate-binding protein [Chloroflexota bacterium]
MKRWTLTIWVLALIASLTVGLIGCSSQTATPSPTAASTKKESAPTEKPASPATPKAGEPKTSDTASKPSGQPIVLGVPTALGTIEGADSLRAVQLAVEEINAKGGVSVGGVKRPFEVVSIDTREAEAGTPTNDALAATEKLITEKKPNAIVVGAFRSEVFLASMDLIAKYKLPYITSIAMTPEFEKKMQAEPEKYKYFFRTGLNAPYLVGNLIKVMEFTGKKFSFKKVYFINQDVAWAKGTSDALEKWAKANGWEVVGHDAYPTGSSDFSSSLNKAKSGGAQLVVPIFDMPQSGVLVKQAKSVKLQALIAGFISPAAPGTAWKAFDGEVAGLVNFLFENGSMPVKAVPKSVAFVENYGKKYGEEQKQKLSGHGPGPAYDSVYVLAAAIEKAGSVDADAVVSALEKTDTDGVIGKIKFNKDHQVIYGTNPKETAISTAFQWKAPGVRVPVFPEAAAEAEIELTK